MWGRPRSRGSVWGTWGQPLPGQLVMSKPSRDSLPHPVSTQLSITGCDGHLAAIIELCLTPSLGVGQHMSPTCQRRKLTLREAEGLAQSHTAMY